MTSFQEQGAREYSQAPLSNSLSLIHLLHDWKKTSPNAEAPSRGDLFFLLLYLCTYIVCETTCSNHDNFNSTTMPFIHSKLKKNENYKKPQRPAAHRASLFTIKQQIHCIYMHTSIQMLCHMDIYNWPDMF